ncbi:MAG: tetratricopeptide repeat protein [Crocosphaera sp.]
MTQIYISEPHLNDLLIQGMEKGIQGDYQGAIADFSEIIRINPQEVEAYYNRGIAYAKLQDYQGAIADFNQALILDPTIAEIYLERAKVYLQLGERDSAIADLNKAKQLFNQQGNRPRFQEVQRLLR